MFLRKILFYASLVTASICLSGGYALRGLWFPAAITVVPLIPVLFARKPPAAWLATVSLVGQVGMAAAGLFAGVPPLLMIAGATAALAAWDLANLLRTMEGSIPTDTVTHFERKHAQTLALALGLGLLLAGGASLVPLPIPFFAMILLVLLDLYCLDQIFRMLQSRGKHDA